MKAVVALLLIASVLVASSPLACAAGGCDNTSTTEAECGSSCGGHCAAPAEKPVPKGDGPEAPQPCIPFMRCCACAAPQPLEPLRLVILLDRNEIAFAPLAIALPTPCLDAIWHPPNIAAVRA